MLYGELERIYARCPLFTTQRPGCRSKHWHPCCQKTWWGNWHCQSRRFSRASMRKLNIRTSITTKCAGRALNCKCHTPLCNIDKRLFLHKKARIAALLQTRSDVGEGVCLESESPRRNIRIREPPLCWKSLRRVRDSLVEYVIRVAPLDGIVKLHLQPRSEIKNFQMLIMYKRQHGIYITCALSYLLAASTNCTRPLNLWRYPSAYNIFTSPFTNSLASTRERG